MTAIKFDEQRVAAAVSYFATLTPARTFSWGTMEEAVTTGLNLDAFYQHSLLHKYLVSRANFATPDEENPVNKEQQQLLLIVYFYSLFFESLMKHKSIVAFLGLAHSGKSTTATAIGKLLFGGAFKGATMPHDARSLSQVMGEHYYYLIENLDGQVLRDMCDVLAGTSTGAGSEERTLGENTGSVFIDTHCHVVITSREPKFKKPDVIERLLIFRMGKIEEDCVKSPAWMERTLLEHRDEIMYEVIGNLNSIVQLLNARRSWERAQGADYVPPGNIFRIADYEEFGKRICSLPARLQFRWALERLMSAKAVMTVEEDQCYQIISYIIIDMNDRIRDFSGQELFSRMKRGATTMEIPDFGTKGSRYPSAMSVTKHLPHIADAMREHLYVDIQTRGWGHRGRKFYTFLRLDQWPLQLPKWVAERLNLNPSDEHDPQTVLDAIRRLDLDVDIEMTLKS